MEIAPDAVEAPPAAPERRFHASDNPLVRAVGRIPLPLGGKLLIGFAVVAALLALVATLGLSALGRANSRGVQLRRLQQKAVYFQLVLADATQLRNAIEYRIKSPASTRHFGSGLDQAITNDFNQLCVDTGYSSNCIDTASSASLPSGALTHLLPTPLFEAVQGNFLTFAAIGGVEGFIDRDVPRTLEDAQRFSLSFVQRLRSDERRTVARTNALVAANRSSYSSSRAVLLGVSGGSLALALALGLLLSWSVVGPLRRTQQRLATIARGDFGGHVDVPNRDEIGALAADVNRMNDELESLYRELETASRHKSEFLATMSHELRTPLNAIIGFSEVLREQMFGELNERQLAYVDDVIEAGKHLLSLINDVLDLAKIEAGRLELELSQVALPELLRGAVSMHSERAGRAGVDLHLHTEPDEIVVTADERRVRQVVFNLLSNAVKFTPPGGRIDVSARIEDNNVLIAVSDTGPGIAPEDREMIFEEFEQTRDGKQVEGTGLGLPLSRKLVELHHGRLWVESEPGKGSTFRVTLPQEVAE